MFQNRQTSKFLPRQRILLYGILKPILLDSDPCMSNEEDSDEDELSVTEPTEIESPSFEVIPTATSPSYSTEVATIGKVSS